MGLADTYAEIDFLITNRKTCGHWTHYFLGRGTWVRRPQLFLPPRYKHSLVIHNFIQYVLQIKQFTEPK